MADIVEKFTVRYWSGSYYASVIFPDGTRQELKSDTDLTYSQWQKDKITPAWEAKQQPEPSTAPTLDGATKEEFIAEAKRRGLTAADLELAMARPVGVDR